MWGLIARAEDRGLGVMTWELARHAHPDRILVVDTQDTRFTQHWDRYPGATRAVFDGERFVDQQLVADWVAGLARVYTAETAYDWENLPAICERAGAELIVHGMPEFYRHHLPGHEHWKQPATWWWPTTWLTDRPELAPGKIVPVPVPDGIVNLAADPADAGPLVVHHVAGHRAHADRNGTLLLFQAIRRARERIHVRVFSQDPLPVVRNLPRNVSMDLVVGGVADRWDMYAGGHVLAMPRRYGGLCLPVQEALAGGLAVVMTDVAPNAGTWPIVPVACTTRQMRVPFGNVLAGDVYGTDLAKALDRLARNRPLLASAQAQATDWARANSWKNLLPRYLTS